MAIDSIMDEVYQSHVAHAVWKQRVGGGYSYEKMKCSCCGTEFTVQIGRQFPSKAAYCSECGKRLSSHFMNYCPNCGAKIVGEVKE